MTDERLPPASADDEMLSAYLLGDCSPSQAEAFEARLATDPSLAARLDALADALVELGDDDSAAPPEGFEDRLEARLREARESATVVPIDAARSRRAGSRTWWASVGTVAAVVALGAVMAGGALRGMGGQDAAVTGDSAGMDTADDSAGIEESAGDTDGGGVPAEPQAANGGDDAEDAAAPVPRPNAPLLLDEQVAIADEAALQRRYAQAPEVQGLLGVPVEEAATLAASFTTAVQRDRTYRAQRSPGDCLDTVTTAADRPLVPARVETVRYEGQPALAYVLVTATPESPVLDRVETWVVSADSCDTLVFQQSQP